MTNQRDDAAKVQDRIDRIDHPMWKEITKSERKDYDDRISYRHYAASERHPVQTFSGEGERWVILQGGVGVYLYDRDGRQIRLCHLGPGAWGDGLRELTPLGEATVELQVDRDTALVFVPDELAQRILLRSESARRAREEGRERMLRQLVDGIAALAFVPLKDRLYALLCQRAARSGDGIVRMTHEELANELGTSREVISRLLKQLSQEGGILPQRRSITVLRR